jgi:hypothetical protein
MKRNKIKYEIVFWMNVHFVMSTKFMEESALAHSSKVDTPESEDHLRCRQRIDVEEAKCGVCSRGKLRKKGID